MLQKFKKTILLSAIICIPFASMAWGLLGHRVVGQIADSYLSKKAKKEIFKILGNESVAMSSNWADFIKSDSNYDYLDIWHYVNLRSGLSEQAFKSQLDADSSINAYTRINWLTAQLRNEDLEQDKKIFYLRLLIHIVGDIHQPLHVGRAEDRGGNNIKLLWFNAPTNLHSIWDTKIVDMQQLSYTEYAAAINHTTKQQRNDWQAEPIGDWIWQSYSHAQGIYGAVKQDDKLGYDYNFKYISLVNQQLLKGGVHLAGLLNDIFKNY